MVTVVLSRKEVGWWGNDQRRLDIILDNLKKDSFFLREILDLQ